MILSHVPSTIHWGVGALYCTVASVTTPLTVAATVSVVLCLFLAGSTSVRTTVSVLHWDLQVRQWWRGCYKLGTATSLPTGPFCPVWEHVPTRGSAVVWFPVPVEFAVTCGGRTRPECCSSSSLCCLLNFIKHGHWGTLDAGSNPARKRHDMAKYFMGKLCHPLKGYILEIKQPEGVLWVNLTSLVIILEKDHEAMSDQCPCETTSLIFGLAENGTCYIARELILYLWGSSLWADASSCSSSLLRCSSSPAGTSSLVCIRS